MSARRGRAPRVLAVASGGGHWIQLRRLRPAFEDADMSWLTVYPEHRDEVGSDPFYVVNDATRWDREHTQIVDGVYFVTERTAAVLESYFDRGR